LQTFVQVTTPANTLISPITDRMPAILPPEAWPMWLGETPAALDEVKALLQSYEDGGVWTMTEQAASRRPARPAKLPSAQQKLF
jgi:putative SOS response-associated peptidase YedK